jgi:hypothetical protein
MPALYPHIPLNQQQRCGNIFFKGKKLRDLHTFSRLNKTSGPADHAEGQLAVTLRP